jgi:hypothetical protein
LREDLLRRDDLGQRLAQRYKLMVRKRGLGFSVVRIVR